MESQVAENVHILLLYAFLFQQNKMYKPLCYFNMIYSIFIWSCIVDYRSRGENFIKISTDTVKIV